MVDNHTRQQYGRPPYMVKNHMANNQCGWPWSITWWATIAGNHGQRPWLITTVNNHGWQPYGQLPHGRQSWLSAMVDSNHILVYHDGQSLFATILKATICTVCFISYGFTKSMLCCKITSLAKKQKGKGKILSKILSCIFIAHVTAERFVNVCSFYPYFLNLFQFYWCTQISAYFTLVCILFWIFFYMIVLIALHIFGKDLQNLWLLIFRDCIKLTSPL